MIGDMLLQMVSESTFNPSVRVYLVLWGVFVYLTPQSLGTQDGSEGDYNVHTLDKGKSFGEYITIDSF